jgi:hypothetical protein
VRHHIPYIPLALACASERARTLTKCGKFDHYRWCGILARRRSDNGAVMLTTVITTVITTVVGGVVLLFIKKLYFDGLARLRVEVRCWETKAPNGLRKYTDRIIGLVEIDKRPHLDESDVRDFLRCSGYCTLLIRNVSKKKISGIGITGDFVNCFYQVDDDATEVPSRVPKDKPIPVGDIQPNHHRKVHLWMSSDLAGAGFVWVKRQCKVTADELDGVSYRFPLPTYLARKYRGRVGTAFFIVNALISASAIAALLLVGRWAAT